jgi:hypothetical protein
MKKRRDLSGDYKTKFDEDTRWRASKPAKRTFVDLFGVLRLSAEGQKLLRSGWKF